MICIALIGMGSGCAGRQLVSSDVPLRRVVLYRNGVGYFERAGVVEGETLTFQVRREHVGDFLATLAVIDREGHARSVSFPSLETDEEVAEGGCECELNDDGEMECEDTLEEEEDDLVDVVLEFTGDDHDLVIAYVVETPIWRPSYRVVLGEESALLQGWAVVQNLSGEDWADVEMSVTSGAPLSFRADLGRPVIPPRPMITDEGEVVAAPVYAETTLRTAEEPEEPMPDADEGGMAPPAPPMAQPSAAPAPRPSKRRASRGQRSGSGGVSTRATDDDAGFGGDMESSIRSEGYYEGTEEALAEAPQTIDVGGLMSSVGTLAAGAVYEGVTRYDVAERVTVPNNGSTMVAIINQTIPGEDALLYRPDRAVPDSTTHPMRVVRLENNTGVLLERGSVAIYQQGALLGQGLLDPLPDGATTSIPFAIERAVAVELAQRTNQSTGRLVKINNGRLTIEQFSQRHTTYRMRNGLDRSTKLYLRHARMTNWDVVDPPEGTEQVEGAMLLPVDLSANEDTSFEVLERTPTRRVVDLMSEIGAQVVLLYLEGPAIDAAAGPVLTQAMEHRRRLMEANETRTRLEQERQELRGAQSDVQSNLHAIRTIARARDLRDRLTSRLTELTARIDSLTNRIVEIDAERSELRVRLSESLRDLTLVVEE